MKDRKHHKKEQLIIQTRELYQSGIKEKLSDSDCLEIINSLVEYSKIMIEIYESNQPESLNYE